MPLRRGGVHTINLRGLLFYQPDIYYVYYQQLGLWQQLVVVCPPLLVVVQ